MKIIVTLGQISLLCLIAYAFYNDGFPTEPFAIGILLIIFIPPLITLYYIHFCVIDSASEINKLTHERRLLEEQTKIDKLRSEMK
jgi:ABC-type glycerol-3-phosphate transport system permease component